MTHEPGAELREFKRGWPIISMAAYGNAVGVTGMLSYPTPYLMQPLQHAFGWSRTQISFAVSLGTLALAIGGPLAGRLCDRYGMNVMVRVSILVVALVLACLALAPLTLWMFYALYALMAFGGAGTSYGPYTRPVAKAFSQGRGIALGLSLTGTGLMAFIAPLTLPGVISAYGWRAGYLTLAVAALLALGPVLLLRRRFEGEALGVRVSAEGLSLHDVLKTRRFWTMMTAGLLTTAVVTGTQLHGLALLMDMKVPKADAERTLAIYGVSMIAARILVGLLLDRLRAPHVALGLYLLPAAGLTLLAVGGSGWAVPAFAGTGLIAAAEGDLMGYLITRYFGLKAYAEVFGWLVASFCLGGMVGAVLASVLHDLNGDYGLWLLGSAAACLCVSALLGSLGRYRY